MKNTHGWELPTIYLTQDDNSDLDSDFHSVNMISKPCDRIDLVRSRSPHHLGGQAEDPGQSGRAGEGLHGGPAEDREDAAEPRAEEDASGNAEPAPRLRRRTVRPGTAGSAAVPDGEFAGHVAAASRPAGNGRWGWRRGGSVEAFQTFKRYATRFLPAFDLLSFVKVAGGFVGGNVALFWLIGFVKSFYVVLSKDEVGSLQWVWKRAVMRRANRRNLKNMLSYREELYNLYIRFLCVCYGI